MPHSQIYRLTYTIDAMGKSWHGWTFFLLHSRLANANHPRKAETTSPTALESGSLFVCLGEKCALSICLHVPARSSDPLSAILRVLALLDTPIQLRQHT